MTGPDPPDLFDCPQRSSDPCQARESRGRCECVFLMRHDGTHFCKWCRQEIVLVKS